jgi:hypothetical protein
MRGDELVERICQGGSDDDTHELLAEFDRGYPINNLRRLLRSDQDRVIKAGAWIISELGQGAAPLMADVEALLRHPLRYARFFALDAVLAAASPSHGKVISRAIRLIDDSDEAVRWKAMQFLSRATPQQLKAGLRHLNEIRIARLVKWLLEDAPADDIVNALSGSDASKRRFGAIAAARIAAATRVPLEHAASSGDLEIRSFAQQFLEHG